MNYENTWDACPTDEIPEHEFTSWIDSYRRRVLATTFPGRTGRRDQSVLLALAAVMAAQKERVIETTTADLVRVAAADHKTIRKAIEVLRAGGFLRVLGPGPLVEVSVIGKRGRRCKDTLWRFALPLDRLEAEPPPVSSDPPAQSLSALATGQLDHDAFGGRRGIKRGDLAVLRWLSEHPGATRYQIAQGVGVTRPTATAAIQRLQGHGLVTMDESNRCYLSEIADESSHLRQVTSDNHLHGSQDRRVAYAVQPFEVVRSQGRSGQAGIWGMPR